MDCDLKFIRGKIRAANKMPESNPTQYNLKMDILRHWKGEKYKLAESKGYSVEVLRKEQLTKEFEWVKNNYQYKRLEQLYDTHKPKFVYECSNCNSAIEKFKEIKTATVFCDRRCSGQYRAKIKHGAMV